VSLTYYNSKDLCIINYFSQDYERLKVKLQEKDSALAQMSKDMEVLRQQVQAYVIDFEAEHQSREQLVLDNNNLKQQLKEREEQFSKFSDDFTTNKFAQATDNDQLQQQLDQLTNDYEQMRRSQQQKDERLTQLGNQVITELQIKEHVLSENQNLKDKLQMIESKLHVLNTELSVGRQQYTTGSDMLSQSLEPTVWDLKQPQVCTELHWLYFILLMYYSQITNLQVYHQLGKPVK